MSSHQICGRNLKSSFVTGIVAASWLLVMSCQGIALSQEEEPERAAKGGIVQQLRSLSQEALETLKEAERPYQPAEVKSYPNRHSPVRRAESQRQVTSPFPPQPTGRATLQRTHSSPWLERFVTKRDAAQATPQPRATTSQNRTPATTSTLAQREESPREQPQRQVVQPKPIPRSGPASVVTVDQLAEQGKYEELQSRHFVHSQQPAPVMRPSELKSANYGEIQAGTNSAIRPVGSQPIPPSASSLVRGGAPAALNSNSTSRTGIGSIATTEARSRTSADNLRGNTEPVQQEVFVAPVAVNQPPKVSRIPLPSTRKIDSQKTASTQSQPKSQSLSEAQAPAKPSREAAIVTKQDSTTRTMTQSLSSLADKPSQLVAPQVESKGVSVPTQLVGVPLAERAARETDKQVSEALSPQAAIERLAVEDARKRGNTASAGKSLDDTRSNSTPTSMPALPDLPSTSAPLATQSPAISETQNQLPMPTLPSAPTKSNSNVSEYAAAPTREISAPTADAAVDERLRMQTPRVEVILNGPADLPVGMPADYEVIVRNQDRIDLNGLVLRLDVPPGVGINSLKPTHGELGAEKVEDGSTLLTWAFENLAAGREARAPVQLTASNARNFAVAMEWTLMPLSGAADVSVSAPRLELALEGPAEVRFGEANTYRLHLRNAGDATAKGVAVKLAAGPYGASTSEVGDIAAGASETVDIELTFNERGNIDIAAEATAVGNLFTKTGIQVVVRQPDLGISVQAPRIVYHGTATQYLVQVQNRGDADAADVAATVTLPAGASPVSLPEGAKSSGDTVTWSIGNVRAGETQEFGLAVNLTGEGENTLELQCVDRLGASAVGSATTVVQAVADLKLFVSDPVAPAPVGSEVVYELNLTNRGSKAANNVKVIAQFSEGIEPTRGEGYEHRVVPGQMFFEPIVSIGAGETIKLKVFAIASSEGTHRFRVDVRTDESEVRLVQEESTQYLGGGTMIAAPRSNAVIR